MNNTLLEPYSPLWQGENNCNKCDALLVPYDGLYQFSLPAAISETLNYVLTINFEGDDLDFELMILEGEQWNISAPTYVNGLLQVRRGGDAIDGIDVEGGCYPVRMRLKDTSVFPAQWEEAGDIGTMYFFTPEAACKNYLRVDYRLSCDQEEDYTFYIDGALARQPLTLADEVNAVDGNGRSRRVFSRTQQTKELRVRPVTLATHELLEYVLNLPTFEIDGTTYTQAEGEVYTFVDAGTSGYYVGRVALVSGGNVFAPCCDVVSPSS